MSVLCSFSFFFFFNDTSPSEIYTLSLHDALPIWIGVARSGTSHAAPAALAQRDAALRDGADHLSQWARSEEHTSELQSRGHLVCRLLLEKKKKSQYIDLCP